MELIIDGSVFYAQKIVLKNEDRYKDISFQIKGNLIAIEYDTGKEKKIDFIPVDRISEISDIKVLKYPESLPTPICIVGQC